MIEKSVASVPVIATLLIEIAVVPSLCNVTVCAAVAELMSVAPKESVCGVTVNALIVPFALPESETLTEELIPEWLKVRVASRVPAAWGAKIIVTLQFEEAARLAPQVLLEMEKSPALVPDIAILPRAMAEVPRLFTVTD